MTKISCRRVTGGRPPVSAAQQTTSVPPQSSDRHRILLVEDDPESAGYVEAILRCHDHDVVAVDNLEDARARVREGGFCLALLDLQVKLRPDAIERPLDGGSALIHHIRTAYPRRNERDKHCLQILVMSEHTRDPEVVTRCMQDGANDFLPKPFSNRQNYLRDKIRSALRHSGRESHAACSAVTEVARATAAASSASHGLVLSVPGIERSRRTSLAIDGRELRMTNASFVILVRLLQERLSNAGSFVAKTELGASKETGWKGMSRLNGELRGFVPNGVELIENDGIGGYRLHPGVSLGEVDWGLLASHSDPRVWKIAREIRRTTATVPPRSADLGH